MDPSSGRKVSNDPTCRAAQLVNRGNSFVDRRLGSRRNENMRPRSTKGKGDCAANARATSRDHRDPAVKPKQASEM